MREESILKKKSYEFAIQIVKLYQHLVEYKKEHVLSKQLLRSGTGIGALIREAEFGQSKADFISKMSIALKEANESAYRLDILKDTEYINQLDYTRLRTMCTEIIKILVSSIKTLKSKK
ncbi:MAG: four helix bundle protein [bacterium]